jgi:hypothetical protein
MNIGELTTFRMGIEVTGGTAGAKIIAYASSGININNGGLFVADTGAVTAGTASGLTTSHLLQSQATADYAVKIVNSNATNGSGLRVQSDATGSTVQRWFCGSTDLGSVAGTGVWVLGAASSSTTGIHSAQNYSSTASIMTFQQNYFTDDGVIDIGGTGTKVRIGRSGGRSYFTGINETAADTDNKAVYVGDNNILNTNTSIAKSKGNIQEVQTSLLSEINRIKVSTFQRKLNTVDEHGDIVYTNELSSFVELGVIADDIKANCPSLAATCLFYDKKGELLGVHIDRLTSAALKAIQELNAKIEALEARLN